MQQSFLFLRFVALIPYLGLLIILGIAQVSFAEDESLESEKIKKIEVLVVVNPANPVEKLTLKQVKQIFLGRMRRFPGVNAEMDVVDLSDSSELHYQFYQQIVNMDPTRLKRYRARYLFSGQGRLPKIVTSESDMIFFVQKRAAAVGYIALKEGEQTPEGLKVLFRQTLK
ncbi:MAG: hypothetical protein MI867_17495 [Pseudomonadales bacterium]|nr:hypothetical protein [Pseudomonadales bacterium]